MPIQHEPRPHEREWRCEPNHTELMEKMEHILDAIEEMKRTR